MLSACDRGAALGGLDTLQPLEVTMRFPALTVAFSLWAAAAAAHAGGVVNVTFVEPDKYYDSGNNQFDKPTNLKTIEAFLQDLGKRYLADGQVLDIEVLNVDLAGYSRPTRKGDLRIVRGGADWPSFQLRYKLSAGGQAVKQAEERVAEMNYTGKTATYAARDPLKYEKQMLDGWFRERFAPAH
jgi:hypothetical protein